LPRCIVTAASVSRARALSISRTRSTLSRNIFRLRDLSLHRATESRHLGRRNRIRECVPVRARRARRRRQRHPRAQRREEGAGDN
jgi:hypothetical protein